MTHHHDQQAAARPPAMDLAGPPLPADGGRPWAGAPDARWSPGENPPECAADDWFLSESRSAYGRPPPL